MKSPASTDITSPTTSSFVGIRIEQKAGYYVCEACGHKYIPSFKSTLFAMHIGRTRYLKCPKCGKTTWNKKVVEK
jgi:DNA-directed RNA polymerase subunit RPC12/RpoP